MDYQNLHNQNPNYSDFDGFDINGQLFWAINIQIFNNSIMLHKKDKSYVKNAKQFSKLQLLNRNHKFVSTHVTSDEIQTSAGNGEAITKNFENLHGIFFSTFKVMFKMLVVWISMVNC